MQYYIIHYETKCDNSPTSNVNMNKYLLENEIDVSWAEFTVLIAYYDRTPKEIIIKEP